MTCEHVTTTHQFTAEHKGNNSISIPDRRVENFRFVFGRLKGPGMIHTVCSSWEKQFQNGHLHWSVKTKEMSPSRQCSACAYFWTTKDYLVSYSHPWKSAGASGKAQEEGFTVRGRHLVSHWKSTFRVIPASAMKHEVDSCDNAVSVCLCVYLRIQPCLSPIQCCVEMMEQWGCDRR